MSKSEQFGAEDAKAIFYDSELFEVVDVASDAGGRATGVWLPVERTDLLSPVEARELRWHPYRILNREGLSSLAHPSLPIPFTAKQLTAVLLAGRGSLVVEEYGEWHDGPDEAQLQRRLGLAEAAQRAMKGAFQAYRDACAIVGPAPHAFVGPLPDGKDIAQLSERLAVLRRHVQQETWKASSELPQWRAERDRSERKAGTWLKAMVEYLLNADLNSGEELSSQTSYSMGSILEHDRGRRVKRKALINENLYRWPTIERDLKDASTNGLSAIAKADGTSWWWESAALNWAQERGKLNTSNTGSNELGRTIHRLSK